jgi:hypothetical protein
MSDFLCWLYDNLIEPLDAVSFATLLLALVTVVLAGATVRLAGQTGRGVGVERNAFLASIRAALADTPEPIARAQHMSLRPNVHTQLDVVQIRVPLRNVGNGLALLQVPVLQLPDGVSMPGTLTATTLTTALRAGEGSDMFFEIRFAEDDARLEFHRDIHEAREFTVVARCQDMNGDQEVRTEATIRYAPPRTAEREGPTYSGEWNFGQVRLFHASDETPFAELPRSSMIAVPGLARRGSEAGGNAEKDGEPG